MVKPVLRSRGIVDSLPTSPIARASVVGDFVATYGLESLRSKSGKRSRKTKSSSSTTQLEGKAFRSYFVRIPLRGIGKRAAASKIRNA